MFFKHFFKPEENNKRSYLRIETEFLVKYRVHNTQDFEFGQCKNMSLGGILMVEIERKLPAETFVDLNFSIPQSFDPTIRSLKVEGKVVHCETAPKAKDKFNCGIKFIKISKEELTLLKKYLGFIQKFHEK